MSSSEYEKEDLKRGVDYIGVNVVFFCHDGQGRVLLSRRSRNCRDECGLWDCGAGSMEHGETFDEAVKREVLEEYLVEPEEIEYVASRNVLRDNGGTPTHWVANLHVVKVDPAEVGIGEPDKIDELGWFRPDEFPAELHSMVPPHFAVVKHQII